MSDIQEFGSKLAFAGVALIIIYNLVMFVKNRRFPSCGRLFGGKKGKGWAANSSEKSGRFWDYKTSSYSHETRSRATVVTPFTCKKCGHGWTVRSRKSRVRKH